MSRSTLGRGRRIGVLAAGCAAVTAVAGCSASGSSASGSSAGGSGSGPAKFVNGATFTEAVIADPGNLDPQMSVASAAGALTSLAYDSLLGQSSKGKIVPQLASDWAVKGKTVALTIKRGITCSDGSAFTAATAAKNINFVGNPKNKSPRAGSGIPSGATATSDAAKHTVTITLPSPAPFVLNGLASLPMVCGKGLANRKTLAQHTDGTGPYVLSQAQPNSRYTLTKRKGYTWGPAGASTATAGMPAKVVLRVIPNVSTQANLLLSGQVNAAQITGPDLKRVQAANLFSAGSPIIVGEQWFNQNAKHLTADPKMREAISLAMDLPQLRKVLTSRQGIPPTTLATVQPTACPGNSIGPALPKMNLDRAKSLLQADGWVLGSDGYRHKGGKKLSLKFVFGNQFGAAGTAAAELFASQMKKLGVEVKLTPQDISTLVSTVLGPSGNWDITWLNVNVSSPDRLIGFLSGPRPSKGSNFASIDNAGYKAAIAKAQTLNGQAGCPFWLKGDARLVKNHDVIPFANMNNYTFGNGAKFQVSGGLVPTSIRMVG